jgi:hypothetical protein
VPAAPHLDGKSVVPSAATAEARTLQASAVRRIWSTLLDYRDWATFVYVPLLIPILVLLPYFVARSYQRSHRLNQLVEALAQGSRDLERMSFLLENNPTPWAGEPAEEARNAEEPDLKGFEILQDSRIVDLRSWKPVQAGNSDPTSLAYIFRRMKVVKQPENAGNNHFRVALLLTSPKSAVRFPQQQLEGKLRMSPLESSFPGQKEYRWEASFDFQRVPCGDFVDLLMEEHSPGQYLERGQNRSALSFHIQAETAELNTWILMPRGKLYRDFRILRHPAGKPDKVEAVKVVTEYLAEDYSILAFKLLSLKPGSVYEISWHYK